MDPVLLIEIGIVAVIILLQFLVFFRNLGGINRLKNLFPSNGLLATTEETILEPPAAQPSVVPQLTDQPKFSTGFREILHMTNEYLRRNKGASQAERLQEIANRKSESIEAAVETNL
ncbi:MAG: hypothetical protein AAF399_23435, partial [Bacteroidota bacterium]